tara:strand:+ start:124 stop:840 length:717 start_codon:yes stop_codon:yes gene_type:complete
MNESSLLIKNIIKYLKDVYDGEKIEGLSQSFFISNKELDKILREYYIFFKNEKELLSDVRYNYNLIKDMSFPYEKEDVMYARDLSIENNVSHTQKEHNRYSHRIHSHLIKAFGEKLGLKKAKEKRRITLKSKKVYGLVEILNLKLDFLKNDSLPKHFIDVLIGKSEQEIHLNIDNRNFHYILTKIKEYFFNFTITAVAKTNKIYSERGNVLGAKNLRNSKVDNPSLKNEIDKIVTNFS